MAEQNINQYVYKKYKINLESDSMDMSLTSDERDYNQEVIFSPFLIAQTYGNRLPISFNISDPLTAQDLTLTYKNYNTNNVFVSQNFYNPKNLDLTCFSSSTACDIGLTGIDNGLVTKMSGETIYFTNGLYDDSLKFDRLHFDRRLKMFQVTGYTETNHRFSGIPKTTLYEVVSKTDPTFGKYHELYGGFYQGFYKLFGYDYDIFPERMNKGWSVDMVIKPRFIDQYFPDPDETTLNEIYPENKNTFFYFGTRAENKFYHHADGSPNCFTGYTRVTSGLTRVQTCACCNTYTDNSRCIYVYPPRSVDNKHDNHLNYGCNLCNGDNEKRLTCGCDCGEQRCDTCGWECQTHNCPTVFVTPTPTPTPTVEQGCYCTPTPTPSFTPTKSGEHCLLPPVCTPSCTGCATCYDCLDCSTTGYTSVEDTCEKDPLFDSLSNAFSLKLCGDPKNPKIGVKVLKITGDCQTSGTCITGQTYVTGYTITEYCSPNGIYDYCVDKCTPFFDVEKWVNINVVWSRYTYLDTCDLKYRGGLDDITKREYLDSLANDTIKLITVPITSGKKEAEMIELVNLNQKWLDDKKYRMGRLRIYVNGKPFYTIEDFEEIIPRALNTDKERQLGVPFNISWGGGTQGLHENLTFSSTTYPYNNYIQDPELFPKNILSGTTFAGMKTNILLEQNFGGTFEGGISQFRMYVTPLSSAEVKHNFKVLQGTFDMFDYDCPDCDVLSCEVNDFTYDIVNDEPVGNDLILGRNYVPDERDKNYLIENKIPRTITPLTLRNWNANEWWGNQGNTPQCVGYAWSHWIEDGPVTHGGIPPIIPPTLIYNEAQKIDEWVGENYDGTSVRAAAKYLKNSGKIGSYLWTFDLNVLVSTVLNVGPVVVGTNWYNGMFYPDRNGLIKITGRIAGGHAYVINGVDTKKQQFRVKNSWGKSWGQQGHAYISFTDMKRLIKENGEICLAVEKTF